MLALHRELLADEVRTNAFRDAIRAAVKPGDVVVDLAFFACEAGARKVYAIEQQHTADAAALLAKHLGLADRIEVIHERSMNVELPERGDVLVTETIGSFGLEERIISNIIDARARLLKANATIIPNRLTLSIVPVELPALHQQHVGWWSEKRFGFDLSPMRVFASNVIYTAEIETSAHLASPAEIIDVDFTSLDVNGRATFEATRDGTMHGFAGWFRMLNLTNAIPRATCWNQVFLPLDEPIVITRGDLIDVDLESHDGTAWRWRGKSFDQTTWLGRPPCIR